MPKNKLYFTKYKAKGPDYHYQQINRLKPFCFNAFVLARYQLHIKFISDYIKKSGQTKPTKILDVGCGDGTLLYLLKKSLKRCKFKLYGIDSSKPALKVAKEKNPQVNFIKGKATDLKYRNNTFDLVISSDVIEHLNNGEKMIKELRRVCKKNGFVIVGTPIRITEQPIDKLHIKEYYPNEFKQMFRKYFSSIKLIKSHPLLFYLLYKQPVNFGGKKIFLFYLLINFLTIIFNINPFVKVQKEKRGYFTYMFLIAKKTT